jgi:hypothetical protein
MSLRIDCYLYRAVPHYLAELIHVQNKEDFNVGLVGAQQGAWDEVALGVAAFGSPTIGLKLYRAAY